MTSDDQTPRGDHGLSDRQLDVWRALRLKAKQGYPFHDWYRGAIWALRSTNEENPDRLAQAANGLRELLEKLPKALGTEIVGPAGHVLQHKRETAGAALTRAKEQFPDGWLGQTITEDVAGVLVQFEEYVLLCARPNRTQRTASGLQKLDPMSDALPERLRRARLERYRDLSKQFESITHHQPPGSEEEFRKYVAELEELLLDLMAPITADDQNRLLELISKGATVSGEEIDEALRLIGRRGANSAFFFDNVRDSVWLKPLRAAGIFTNPPNIEPAGEGYVRFPVWWPMQFLKRACLTSPAEVLQILLQMGNTDNPQVLNGVVEIAAELPIELSVQLEPMIKDYIQKPFHV